MLRHLRPTVSVVSIVLLVAFVGASCASEQPRATPSPPDDAPKAPSGHDHHGSLDPLAARHAAATDRERAAAAALLDGARETTVRFADEPDARSAGFVPAPSDGRLIHYRNPANRRDPEALDPARPEGLVYLRTESGEMRLLGVVFTVRSGQDAPVPGGGLFRWHTHDPSCGTFLVEPDTCTGTFRMLHVWTFATVADPWQQHLREARAAA